MTNTKTTKRALLTSVLSIVICLTMLIGSTFAWFTDSATTGVNKITAGNLDVGLKYSKNFSTWNDAESETEIFKKNALWEPGYTEVVYFEVENKGNLAFNYRVGTNLVNNVIGKTQDDKDIDLTKYIKLGIVEVDKAFANRDAALDAVEDSAIDFADLFVAEDSLTTKGATQKFAMVVFMPTTVNNEANHNGTDIPSIEFGVQVIATQKAEESDSYGNDYDKDATYPQFAFVKYEADKDLVLKGENFEAVIPANTDLETSEDHQDVVPNTELVMKIEEADSAPNITVAVGDIVLPYTISLETKDGEAVESTNNEITVELNIGAGRGTVELYHYTEKVEGAAYDSTTGILTFTTKDFSPFTVVEKAVITADTSWYNETDTEFVLKDAADMFGLAALVDAGNSFANKTVKLGANIDLEYAEWEAIGDMNNYFSGNFDGQGYTVSNLKITKTVENLRASNRQGLFSSVKPVGATYFKNVTLHNADITAGYHVGGLIGTSDGSSQSATGNYLVVTDIKLTGFVQIYGWEGVAGVMGSGNMAEISNITVDVEEGSYVTTMPNGRTNSFACVGSVKGGGYLAKIDNIKSNMDVTAKTAGTGGLFGVVGGQTVECKVSNLSYSGKVTLTESSVDKTSNYCNYQYNGLLIGAPRFSLIADQSTCTSNGTLELHTENSVETSNKMNDTFNWGSDLFGASRDFSYTNKSYAKAYTSN